MLPGHFYNGISSSWLFFVRVQCSCGWHTRRYVNAGKAAGALLRHQATARGAEHHPDDNVPRFGPP